MGCVQGGMAQQHSVRKRHGVVICTCMDGVQPLKSIMWDAGHVHALVSPKAHPWSRMVGGVRGSCTRPISFMASFKAARTEGLATGNETARTCRS